MNLKIVSGRSGTVRHIDLKSPKAFLTIGGSALVAIALIFAAGVELGRFMAGPLQSERFAQEIDAQRMDIETVRGQLQGKVDALAERVGTMNAHLIRLDALGKRITDLANLNRGEFDFDKPPPVGGPEGGEAQGGSVRVPELTSVLDALEAQLADRERQLTVLETLMSTRQLGQRVLPTGWPVVGGWISSNFGYRSDPFTGAGAFHAGVDFAADPGSRVLATGPGVVTYAGYKNGYGNVVEITHPTGYLTRYGHNSRNLVREGDTVQKGQAIAIVGSTGRSTGTHVHFEVERGGNTLNPMRYLSAP
jgi:murein DD-endopeptidase MepM/ murein hydrolase activator NlpD